MSVERAAQTPRGGGVLPAAGLTPHKVAKQAAQAMLKQQPRRISAMPVEPLLIVALQMLHTT